MGNINAYRNEQREDEFEGMEFVPVNTLIAAEQKITIDSVKIVQKKDGDKGVFIVFNNKKNYTWSQAISVVSLLEKMDAANDVAGTQCTLYKRKSQTSEKTVVDLK